MKVNEITEGWLGQALGAFTRKSSKSQWSPPDIPAADLPNPDTTPVNRYGAWTAQATPAPSAAEPVTTPKVKPAKMSMGGQATASFGGGQSYQTAPATPAPTVEPDIPLRPGYVIKPGDPHYEKFKQQLISKGAWPPV
jgi:hypothetical protein